MGAVAVTLWACAGATAGDLIYTPVNPSFGGNAFNSQHLLGLANIQNEFKDDGQSQDAPLSSSERFLQMLESRLYSSLAQEVSDTIFGTDGASQGTITFQDQTIHYDKTDSQITLTITDTTTGQVTQIVVPTLVSGP
jgi:curli production assembly/transport component CsgF